MRAVALVDVAVTRSQGVTGEQLQAVLSDLQAQGRVLADASGLYRKGLATPSASRRAATPSASRRPPAAGPSVRPRSPLLAARPHPCGAPDASHLVHNASSRRALGLPAGSPAPTARRIPSASSPSASRPSSSPSSSSSQPEMSPNQLGSYETRVLSLLANYSSSTAERIHAQLKATSDFPGTQQVRPRACLWLSPAPSSLAMTGTARVGEEGPPRLPRAPHPTHSAAGPPHPNCKCKLQDTLRLLRNLAADNRVRDVNGNFSYLSTRQSTPTGARGSGASPSLARRLPSPPPIPRAGSPPPMRSNGAGALSNGIGAPRSNGSSSSSSSAAATFATAGAASSGRSPSPGPVRGPSRMVSARSMSSGAAATAAASAAAESLRGARAAAGRSALPTSARRGGAAEQEEDQGGAARRSLSAYSLFCAERKEAVRAALPRAGAAEVSAPQVALWGRNNSPGGAFAVSGCPRAGVRVCRSGGCWRRSGCRRVTPTGAVSRRRPTPTGGGTRTS